MVLFVDETRNVVGLLVKVLRENQGHLLEYVKNTYTNVGVFVQDNWLRLDFNKDGMVSIDDVRKSLTELYEFLKSYDYIEATTRIKSEVYAQAKVYMQSRPKLVTNQQGDIPIEEGDIPIVEAEVADNRSISR